MNDVKTITVVIQQGMVDSVYCDHDLGLDYQVLDLDTTDGDEAAVNCSIVDSLAGNQFMLSQVQCNKSVCTNCINKEQVCIGCELLDKERVKMDLEDRILKAKMFDSLLSTLGDTDNFAYGIISCLLGEGYDEKELEKFFDKNLVAEAIKDNKNI